MQPDPSQTGKEKAKSVASRPKSAAPLSAKVVRRLHAKRMRKIMKAEDQVGEVKSTQAESYVSGASYISQLENDLDKERVAR